MTKDTQIFAKNHEHNKQNYLNLGRCDRDPDYFFVSRVLCDIIEDFIEVAVTTALYFEHSNQIICQLKTRINSKYTEYFSSPFLRSSLISIWLVIPNGRTISTFFFKLVIAQARSEIYFRRSKRLERFNIEFTSLIKWVLIIILLSLTIVYS